MSLVADKKEPRYKTTAKYLDLCSEEDCMVVINFSLWPAIHQAPLSP
jgi:hypothetical protein